MRRSVMREIREAGHASYYAIVLLFTAGLLGIAITGDVFNLYVFLEIASITLRLSVSTTTKSRSAGGPDTVAVTVVIPGVGVSGQ